MKSVLQSKWLLNMSRKFVESVIMPENLKLLISLKKLVSGFLATLQKLASE